MTLFDFSCLFRILPFCGRYEIHHKEWDIRQVEFSRLDINYKLTGSIDLGKKTTDAFHFSKGVKVISWKKELLF